MFTYVILISIVPTIVVASVGIDVSYSVSRDQFACLKDSGYKFVIVRIYRSVGVVDLNSGQTIKNARAVGFTNVDAYLLPCVSCGDASLQIIEAINYLKDEGARIDKLWLDIEGKWTNDTDYNVRFVDELICQINNLSILYGIYTSKHHWVSITKNIPKYSLQSPLWYGYYDGDQSFQDFEAFGGWEQPSMKQFISDAKECGVVLNKNYV